MTAENLKEILLNVKPGDYNKIMEYQITQEDIKDFYNKNYNSQNTSIAVISSLDFERINFHSSSQ